MIIGIDGNEANGNTRVGIGEYAYQVLTHLYKKAQGDRVKFKIYLKDRQNVHLPPENSWWEYKVFGPKSFWTQIALPLHLFLESEKPNVFFSPTHYAPRFASCRRVISIMDLSFIFFPAMFRKKDLWQLKLWTNYSVRNAWKIFTISQFSKQAIVDYYKIPEEKVVVTYPGYDKNKFKIQSANWRTRFKIAEIKRKYEIDGDYILFVGTLQPRKNISRLIEAFNMMIQQSNNEKTQLVIVGKRGWLFEEIFKKVEELNLSNKVIFTDYVPEADLPNLYRGAKCLVLPSLYEGFGLPVIEAMACGTPVVVSNASSLPEIVGKAGILVNPKDVKDITAGIYTASFDLNKRAQLMKKGLERVKLFSWEKCTEITLKIIEKSIN